MVQHRQSQAGCAEDCRCSDGGAKTRIDKIYVEHINRVSKDRYGGMDQQHIPYFEFLKGTVSHNDISHCKCCSFFMCLEPTCNGMSPSSNVQERQRFQRKYISCVFHVILCKRRLKCYNSLTIIDRFPYGKPLLPNHQKWCWKGIGSGVFSDAGSFCRSGRDG